MERRVTEAHQQDWDFGWGDCNDFDQRHGCILRSKQSEDQDWHACADCYENSLWNRSKRVKQLAGLGGRNHDQFGLLLWVTANRLESLFEPRDGIQPHWLVQWQATHPLHNNPLHQWQKPHFKLNQNGERGQPRTDDSRCRSVSVAVDQTQKWCLKLGWLKLGRDEKWCTGSLEPNLSIAFQRPRLNSGLGRQVAFAELRGVWQ